MKLWVVPAEVGPRMTPSVPVCRYVLFLSSGPSSGAECVTRHF
jgi:hypothetical protein